MPTNIQYSRRFNSELPRTEEELKEIWCEILAEDVSRFIAFGAVYRLTSELCQKCQKCVIKSKMQ